jgi:hypothetical protein
LYQLVRDKSPVAFAVAVLLAVLLLRMIVVPGRVWTRVLSACRGAGAAAAWTAIVVLALPPAIALCTLGGASLVMAAAALLVLALQAQ